MALECVFKAEEALNLEGVWQAIGHSHFEYSVLFFPRSVSVWTTVLKGVQGSSSGCNLFVAQASKPFPFSKEVPRERSKQDNFEQGEEHDSEKFNDVAVFDTCPFCKQQ